MGWPIGQQIFSEYPVSFPGAGIMALNELAKKKENRWDANLNTNSPHTWLTATLCVNMGDPWDMEKGRLTRREILSLKDRT